MDDLRGPSRKPLPHSRSISLQMLTHTPSSAPLETKMFSESLKPLRPPPIYSTDSFMPAPALPAFQHLQDSSMLSGVVTEASTSPPAMGLTTHVEHDTVPISAMFTTTNIGRRVVSMPAPQPSMNNVSSYDDMFTFPTQLPDNFVDTVRVPQEYGKSGASVRAPPGQVSGSVSDREDFARSDRAVSATATMRTAPQATYSPPVYSTIARSPAIPSNLRSVSSSSSQLQSPIFRSLPPSASGLSDKGRRPSVMNTLGSWIDKRKDSSRTSNIE